MRTNRHFFSPFMCVFLLHHMEKALSTHTHRHFFSPLPMFFSSITWASKNAALLCIYWHFAVHHISFLRHQHAQWFLQLLNWLHAFVGHWVHCFLHILKSVVVLLACQLEKCLEKGKPRMNSCLCLHKWLGKIFV